MTPFDTWLKRVDAALIEKSGLGIDCLADIDYGSLFEDGDSPDSAAKACLRANDFPEEFL